MRLSSAGDQVARPLQVVAAALAAGLVAAFAPPQAAPAASAAVVADPLVSVIIRELPGAGDAPEHAVLAAGGQMGRQIGLIGGFSAQVPAGALAAVADRPDVHSVTPNQRVQLHSAGRRHVETDPDAFHRMAQDVTGAGEYWNSGITGKGVGVAVIDSGVVPVNGLRKPGKVIHGPDLSFESEIAGLRNLDTYGHGTHMAGIIAGRDDAAPDAVHKSAQGHFLGMAPDAKVISLKVADSTGATDVSQVIAAIDWVVAHKDDRNLNIRVLNLSFGTDGVQDYRVDPLTYAVEVAWHKGIVVVVSAGNEGFGSAKLNNPAYDPYVLAVGGADGQSTASVSDDRVEEWSSSGDGTRNPDVVAPGSSIVSLRNPGSRVDTEFADARVSDRFFRGTGTSQAAAVASGAAALIVQQRPGITPDQVKDLLRTSAQRLRKASAAAQGTGMIDLKRALKRKTPKAVQSWARATGTGSLELARGEYHVVNNGVELRDEQHAFGGTWNGSTWATASLNGTTWTGGAWSGTGFTGGEWQRARWASSSWLSSGSLQRARWAGSSWEGSWSDAGADGDLQRARWARARWASDGWG